MSEHFISAHVSASLNSNVANGVFLVVSNVFLAPAILESLQMHEWASAVIYFNVMVASTIYHSCRAEFGCLIDSPRLESEFLPVSRDVVQWIHSRFDVFFVFNAIMWTLTSIGRSHAISHHTRLLVYEIFFLPLAFFVFGDFNDLWAALVGGLLPGAVMLVLCAQRGTRAIRRWHWFLLGVALAAFAGFFMYLMPYRTYGWSHGVWHITSMLALVCFNKATRRNYAFLNPLDDPEHFPPLAHEFVYDYRANVYRRTDLARPVGRIVVVAASADDWRRRTTTIRGIRYEFIKSE